MLRRVDWLGSCRGTVTYDTWMPPRPSVHAVFFALNEVPFFRAALASVYDVISGATVITRYDRDRYGAAVEPEGLVEALLSRDVDPERKVELIVTNEGNEAQARNRAMAYAQRQSRVRRLAGEPRSIPAPDLFWHIDADEVYDPDDIPRLLAWVSEHPAQAYRLELRTYFRTWNWRVTELGTFTAMTRPGFRFGDIRDPYPTCWRRGWGKASRLGLVSEDFRLRRERARLVPPEVAVCHHGSYVGDRDRVAQKVRRSSHRTEIADDWLARVWDKWNPDLRDLHPTDPPRFPAAVHVPTRDLPPAIRDGDWPEGWIERS